MHNLYAQHMKTLERLVFEEGSDIFKFHHRTWRGRNQRHRYVIEGTFSLRDIHSQHLETLGDVTNGHSTEHKGKDATAAIENGHMTIAEHCDRQWEVDLDDVYGEGDGTTSEDEQMEVVKVQRVLLHWPGNPNGPAKRCGFSQAYSHLVLETLQPKAGNNTSSGSGNITQQQQPIYVLRTKHDAVFKQVATRGGTRQT